MRENKGITLIALAITIIVLLILAGVTIGMITSDNGVIKEAKSTAEESRGASVEEAKDLWLIKREGGGKQDLDGILAELEKQGLLSSSEVSEIKNNANNEIKIGSRIISFKLEEEKGPQIEQGDPNLWSYELDPATNNTTAIITGYRGTGRPTEITIPNYINEIPVKKIRAKTGGSDLTSIWSNLNGEGICEDEGKYQVTQKSVKKVIISEGIEEIGSDTFRYSRVLEEVVVPFTVSKIGVGAFSSCNQLNKIDLKNVTTIGNGAFRDDLNLTEINVTKSNFTIGSSAFGNCHNLNEVNLGPRGTIESYAFENCKSLTYIKIPSGVELIGESVFWLIPNIVVEEGYLNASSTWNRDWNKTSSGIVTLKPGK